jgi:DNA uptake protein ComE-like DNA-binding protein
MSEGRGDAHPVPVTRRDPAANWVWISLIPMGLGAWAPMYAGTVARNRRWWVLGLVWSLVALAGWVLAAANPGRTAGGLLIIAGWTGGIASSFAIRGSYRQQVGSTFESALASAERRLSERDRARQLARDRPAVAKELGVGRPDLPGAQDAGLVDLNNAPAAVLASLPGVDDALATRIVEARAQTHGFSSADDLGIALDLDGQLVEDLRNRVVFLPR